MLVVEWKIKSLLLSRSLQKSKIINAVGYQTGKYQVLENQAPVSVVGNVKVKREKFMS